MKILITGIGGFVGKYLMEALLVRGEEVHGTTMPGELFDDSRITLHTLEITNKENVGDVIRKICPDQIYHLAGQSSVGLSWKDPSLTVMTNVVGTINLLDAIRETNINTKVLIIGSSDQYGRVKPEDCPLCEEQPLNPQSPYATSKKAQEEIAKQYVQAHNMKIIMARAFNHIGPGQKRGFVIADFASQIAEIEKGLKEPILRVGNLDAKRDFNDVRDIVDAYIILMDRGRTGEVYNVGSGKAHSVREMLERLLVLANVPISVEQVSDKIRPSDIPLVQCDNSKIVRDMGWQMSYSLEKTLEDTLNYWRSI